MRSKNALLAMTVSFLWVFTMQRSIEGAAILSQNLGASAYTASRSPSTSVDAFDGNLSTMWNSGGYASAWIEVNLGAIYKLEQFKLVVAQSPSGNTTHQIWVSDAPIGASTSLATLAKTFNQSTSDNETLIFNPTGNVFGRYVQVRTTASPSWVAWREVQVYGTPIPEPTSASICIGGFVIAGLRRVSRKNRSGPRTRSALT
jgi:hypothetical protein